MFESRRIERVLTTALVLLKLHVLYDTWGRLQGFDANPWLDVFRATHWFERLPAPKALFASYHPPLSYLVCRWIYAVYPHEVEASQILSTLAMICAVFALRSTLRTAGVLWTLPGLTMLYVAASMPVIVWLGIETSYDALVFMWFVITLAISTRLFWTPPPPAWWRKPGYIAGIASLGLGLAAGLLTKFNATFAFGLPFLVILARRGLRSLLRECGAAFVAVIIGILAVSPLYYFRYYKPLGQIFPQPMEWLRADDLTRGLALRNAEPWRSLFHMLRIPEQSIIGTQEPVTDSFVHSIWLQVWKRDVVLGPQGELSLAISNQYVQIFPVIVLAAVVLFVVRRRKLPAAWSALGYILATVSATFCLALLYFGWKYPIWDWRVFKAKYMTPAVLFIPYCVALLSRSWLELLESIRQRNRLANDVVLLLVILFMFANHLLPVY